MSARRSSLVLLEAAYRRGWLRRSAQEKAAFLLEQGLHIEQVLLGMGLLTPSQYGELVAECFSVRLERLDQDRWLARGVDGTLPATVAAAQSEDEAAVWLIADAWEEPMQSGTERKEPAVYVLFSDLLRWRRRPEPTDFAVSDWWRAWRVAAATEARICVEQGAGMVWVGPDAEPATALSLAKEEVPALQTWFEVGYPQQAWQAKRIPGLEGDLLEVVARHEVHPVARLAGWQDFLKEPRGVLLCLAPDAWLEARLSVLPEASDPHSLFHQEGVQRVHPRAEPVREVAWQAALAGISFCWVEEAPQETAWIRALAQAGVPITVVRRRETLHGSAWEAYHLSYESTRSAARG